MPGPAATPYKPFSRHRGRSPSLVLPRECVLPAPEMPAGRDWSEPARELWRGLWRAPQATMWDESYAASVAMYVAHTIAVVEGTASAWQAQEARHLGDRLGLTPQGMASLGWSLEEPKEPRVHLGLA